MLVAGKAHRFQQVPDPLLDGFFRHAGVLAQAEGHVFSHIQEIEQGGILEHHAHVLAQLVPLVFRIFFHRLALDQHLAPLGLQKADQQLQHSAFAGTGGTDHRQGLPFGHGKIHPVQDHLGPEGHLHIPEFNDRSFHFSLHGHTGSPTGNSWR